MTEIKDMRKYFSEHFPRLKRVDTAEGAEWISGHVTLAKK
jgi:hypothetical protein